MWLGGSPVRSENQARDFSRLSVTKQSCMILFSSNNRLSNWNILLLEDLLVVLLERRDRVVGGLVLVAPEVVHHGPDGVVPVGIGDVERVGHLPIGHRQRRHRHLVAIIL